MKALVLLALVACGGTPTTIPTDDAGPSVDAGPIVCDLGGHGGPVACDPNAPWWFVASSDGHEDTFASCDRASCPLTVACFVGSAEGYCR